MPWRKIKSQIQQPSTTTQLDPRIQPHRSSRPLSFPSAKLMLPPLVHKGKAQDSLFPKNLSPLNAALSLAPSFHDSPQINAIKLLSSIMQPAFFSLFFHELSSSSEMFLHPTSTSREIGLPFCGSISGCCLADVTPSVTLCS